MVDEPSDDLEHVAPLGVVRESERALGTNGGDLEVRTTLLGSIAFEGSHDTVESVDGVRFFKLRNAAIAEEYQRER